MSDPYDEVCLVCNKRRGEHYTGSNAVAVCYSADKGLKDPSSFKGLGLYRKKPPYREKLNEIEINPNVSFRIRKRDGRL